jgi:rhodanese-related sulfurtransferase
MKPLTSLAAAVIWAALVMFLAAAATATAAPTMTKEQLQKQMGDPQVVILDVRTGRDWSSSEFKIKGAERVDPQNYQAWSDKYPKDKTLVLYCA